MILNPIATGIVKITLDGMNSYRVTIIQSHFKGALVESTPPPMMQFHHKLLSHRIETP